MHVVLISPYLSNSVISFFVASLLVLFFNVGIPNELKGCLFFIQVRMALFPNQSINHCMILISLFPADRLLGLFTRALMELAGTFICLEYSVSVSIFLCVLIPATLPSALLLMDSSSHC